MILMNGEKINQATRFPDGTLAIRTQSRRSDSPYIIRWHYECESELIPIFYLTKHLKSHGCQVILEMPYVPNGRMDRVKKNDEVFTLKYFTEFINSLEFERVVVLDPHSPVTEALIQNLVYTDPMEFINKTIVAVSDPELVLFYPDEGAMKRYSEMIESPYGFGIKRRDWRTGEILKLDIVGEEVIAGKNVLIVDDICSAGGTFYYSAKALKEAGAENIYLHVSHCEPTIHRGKLLDSDLLAHIYTTDSIVCNERSSKITRWEI